MEVGHDERLCQLSRHWLGNPGKLCPKQFVLDYRCHRSWTPCLVEHTAPKKDLDVLLRHSVRTNQPSALFLPIFPISMQEFPGNENVMTRVMMVESKLQKKKYLERRNNLLYRQHSESLKALPLETITKNDDEWGKNKCGFRRKNELLNQNWAYNSTTVQRVTAWGEILTAQKYSTQSYPKRVTAWAYPLYVSTTFLSAAFWHPTHGNLPSPNLYNT